MQNSVVMTVSGSQPVGSGFETPNGRGLPVGLLEHMPISKLYPEKCIHCKASLITFSVHTCKWIIYIVSLYLINTFLSPAFALICGLRFFVTFWPRKNTLTLYFLNLTPSSSSS